MGRCLEAEGWSVLDRNWTTQGGELDLVVERAGCLRFVEVKARKPGDPSGLESVTVHKRRRLIRAARAWLAAADPSVEEIAFSLALVTLGTPEWSLELIDDPFDA